MQVVAGPWPPDNAFQMGFQVTKIHLDLFADAVLTYNRVVLAIIHKVYGELNKSSSDEPPVGQQKFCIYWGS